MVHVGMDLHNRMAYVRAMSDNGELFKGRKINLSDLSRLWEYLDAFNEPVRVVFEAVSNSRWMARQLRSRPNCTAVVVTPHKVRIIAETVAKTDKIDAEKLALLSKIDLLPEAWMPDERIERLRELVRHRAKQVQTRTRCKNEITGVLTRSGLQRPYDNIFGTYGRQWLAEIELPTVMRLQVDNWLTLLDEVEAMILGMDRRIGEALRRDEQWREDAELLQTIPHVSYVTIATLLAELGDYRRFRSRSQVAAYVGLVPSSKRSADTKRYGRLTKRGSTELRRVLTQVALGSARKVPRYGQLYDRIASERCANVAKSAIARRLVEDAWTMLMKREPFRLTSVQAGSLTRVG